MTIKKITNEEDKPQGTVIDLNEPNMELMAKAFLNLYYQTKRQVKKNG